MVNMASRILVAACVLGAASQAHAVPAFARKHGTSCLTCHTAFPKLTPFGEAFRRNGYRFPGVDGDYVKGEVLPLAQEAAKKTFPDSVWPASIPSSPPIAVGFLASASIYPDKTASVPRENHGTQVSLDGLSAEGQLFLGAGLSDTVTVFAEVAFADGGAEVEHAQLFFNDLFGPAHAFNLAVGKGTPSVSSFGPHSSYAGGLAIPDLPVTAIHGISEEPFVLGGNYPGVELTGVVGGRFHYALGVSAGANGFGGTFSSENWYLAAGYKVGGMRLDGEGAAGPTDPLRPWAENAVTVHGFLYQSNERFPDPADPGSPLNDVSLTAGGGLRAQYGSAELDLGYYRQSHSRGDASLRKVTADAIYGELSYVVYPWLVPFLRAQRISLSPSGGSTASDLLLMPGVAILIRPNVKLMVAGSIEAGNGFPQDATGVPLPWQGGSGDTGAFVLSPRPGDSPARKAQELSSITLQLAWAL